jgi:hypothetical protein
MTPPHPARSSPPPLIWWLIWAAIATGLIGLSIFVPASSKPGIAALRYAPLVPLLLSSGLRWLVLPRVNDGTRAFPIFVVGLALAEGSAVLGLFLVPELRTTYVALGLLCVGLYAPTYARRYFAA